MDAFKEIVIMTRVVNAGIIMSIEKNEKELKGLMREIVTRYGFPYCSLCNTFYAAFHSAIHAHGYRRNDLLAIKSSFLTDEITRFIQYLGLKIEPSVRIEDGLIVPDIGLLNIESATNMTNISTAIIDFTHLGYGPAAAMLTKDKQKYLSAERLKIFGLPDLQTMWEDKETNPDIISTIQFNYRLSPLVAALVRNEILERGKQ